MNSEWLVVICGLAVFLVTIRWVRVRALAEKFALFWLLAAGIVLVCGFWPDLIKKAPVSVDLLYLTLVLGVSVCLIGIASFVVSVILTRHHRRLARLAQGHALLEYELHRLVNRLQELQEQSERPALTSSAEEVRKRAA